MRIIAFLLLLFCAAPRLQAQDAGQQSPPMNQTDAKGLRQGMWWQRQPEALGERSYIEWGIYSNGHKNGLWYKMNNDGDILSIEHYRDDLLDGEVKYFENGRLTVVGHYYGLNPAKVIDTVLVVEPVTHEEKLVAVRTDRGSLRHGLWQFYDPQSGRLIREEYYQADDFIYRKEFPMSPADSNYYKQREANLPHMKKNYYKPPAGKQSLTR